MRTLSRRTFLGTAAGSLLPALGCSSSRGPVAGSTVASGPAAAVPTPAGSGGDLAPGPDWERRWAALVAAAMAEGKLSLLTWADTWGGPGYAGFSGVAARFGREFPGIDVAWAGESSARNWLEWIRQGRRNGNQRFDIALVQSDSALAEGKPDRLWSPVRPLLFRPDVIDDGGWRDSFEGRFLDAGADLCFGWEYQVLHAYAVNTDHVTADEIRTVGDLLNPKWRGKFVSLDPRAGILIQSAAAVARSTGTDAVRGLLVDQQPRFTGSAVDLAQEVVSGRQPIAMGLRPKALKGDDARLLGSKIRFLDLPEADFATTTSMLHLDGAQHPAASALFANWILTRDGQALLTSSLPTNSARIDVAPAEPHGVPAAGTPYYEPQREANYTHNADIQRFVGALSIRIG